MSKTNKVTVGVVGLFSDTNALMHSATTVRDAGYKKWDCHTPFPVHGLDGAMGLKDTPIPYIVLTMGFIGLACAIAMQGWMNAIDYKIIFGGKPFFAWPAFVPICFELFVLFTAIAISGSLLFFCKLLKWHHPLHDSNIMKEVTCDKFAVVLQADDALFTEEKATKLLERSGCKDIRLLYEIDDDGKVL